MGSRIYIDILWCSLYSSQIKKDEKNVADSSSMQESGATSAKIKKTVDASVKKPKNLKKRQGKSTRKSLDWSMKFIYQYEGYSVQCDKFLSDTLMIMKKEYLILKYIDGHTDGYSQKMWSIFFLIVKVTRKMVYILTYNTLLYQLY